MKKIQILPVFLLIFLLPNFVKAQVDCSNFLASKEAEPPFEISSLSKSATCVTGKTYELTLPLQANKEYRIFFYASSLFNNQINFKIQDLNTYNVLYDVPGTEALEATMDSLTFISKYPHFDVVTTNATSIKIIIEVLKQDDVKYGCVGVLVLERAIARTEGFK